MDQFNLFEDTPTTTDITPTTIVEHTAPEPAVAPSRDDKPRRAKS